MVKRCWWYCKWFLGRFFTGTYSLAEYTLRSEVDELMHTLKMRDEELDRCRRKIREQEGEIDFLIQDRDLHAALVAREFQRVARETAILNRGAVEAEIKPL